MDEAWAYWDIIIDKPKVNRESPEEFRDRLFNDIDRKIEYINELSVPENIKEAWLSQLESLKIRFDEEFNNPKYQLRNLKQEIDRETTSFYYDILNTVEGVSVYAKMMEVIYQTDQNKLTPENIHEPFVFDWKEQRAIFKEKKIWFLPQILKEPFQKQLYIEWINNPKIINLINQIYLSKDNFTSLINAINLTSEYDISKWEKYALFGMILLRTQLNIVNSVEFNKEERAIQNAIDNLEQYPILQKKLKNLIESQIFWPK